MEKFRSSFEKANLALVEKFNRLFPVGSVVTYRIFKHAAWKKVTVAKEAYLNEGGNAVAFFKELSGCYSIDGMFVDYDKV